MYLYYYANSFSLVVTHFDCFLQACQAEIRKPLVDLGVSEYSIIPTIDSLVDTENEFSSGQASDLPSADLTLFKQIALDLRELCLWVTTEIAWYFPYIHLDNFFYINVKIFI